MKAQEGLLDVGHVAVEIHVLAVEVGDDGEDGRELEEGAVALVGLGDEVRGELPRRALEPRASTRPPTTTVGSRPPAARTEGDHRGGGGFAVHAGDSDAVFEAHQLGQHLGSLNDGNLAGVGLEGLRDWRRGRRSW